MRTKAIYLILVLLCFSFACQALFPTTPPPRDGVVIDNCSEFVKSIRSMQTNDTPQELIETGIKQGG